MTADDGGSKSPLRSVHTTSVPEILQHLGISLVISTYQAGKVIVLRTDHGLLNTHFRGFPHPMGMAAWGGRLAMGVGCEVIELHNMPAVAERIESDTQHDACYLPRRSHVTGDIDVHEMAFAWESGSAGPLWLVNARFSCLCTLDDEHSFVPQWWPPFIKQLAPDDRCHLNGLAMVDGAARFVTALGDTDSRSGWRDNKASGGILIDIESGETIVRGLSMPHSPRWYGERLWLLESGDGSFGTVELSSGRYEPVVKLDGFTRGLSLCGDFAFVGLSQVRESAIFSGIQIAERSDRKCGVVVMHVPTGQQVGFVHFEGAVQEIFAVEVLPHRFPEILEPNDDLVANSFAVPDETLAAFGKR